MFRSRAPVPRLPARERPCRSRCARASRSTSRAASYQLVGRGAAQGRPGRALRGLREAEGEARRPRDSSRPARKRALPAFPRAIGIVTSPAAAALRDMLTTLARRAPMIPVILYPAPVQGEGAGAQIARAIALANARARGATCSIVVPRRRQPRGPVGVQRGGGGARHRGLARFPIVSGVGHETDFSIADFVADLRAPTPTAAAAAASPDREALLRRGGGAAAPARARPAPHRGDAQRSASTRLARRLLTPAERIARQRETLSRCIARRLRNAVAAGLALAARAPRERAARGARPPRSDAGARARLQHRARCRRHTSAARARASPRGAPLDDHLLRGRRGRAQWSNIEK